MADKAKEIMERIEDEACRICKKDPLSKDDVMILGQLVDMMKDLSTTTTMDEYSDMYLTPEEYSERWHSMRRGRSPSTGRFTSMRAEPYMDSYRDSYGNGSYGMRSMGSYNDGYSGHSINDRMIDALERMMDTAKTEHERETIRKRIEEIRRDK
jgi:hypothetical protein